MWFRKIPPNTIGSFEELSKLFVNNFIGGQRHKRSSSSLLTIEQGENESLQSFITCFNKEALIVDEMDDKLLLAAFHNGVSSDLCIHKLYDQEPQTMDELVHSTLSFMNAEDAIIDKKRKGAEQTSHVILNKALAQRRLEWERRKIETIGRQVHLQEEVSITRP